MDVIVVQFMSQNTNEFILHKKILERMTFEVLFLFTFSLCCVHYHNFAQKVQSETNICAVLSALGKCFVSYLV